MHLKCGIVGLPNVGKSTLLNALADTEAQAGNFPFCTIKPNIGMVNVPDARLTQLIHLVNPKRTVPTTIEFIDIAGLVQGAHKGEGLGNQFLANIRETNLILHTIRCFDNPDVTHVAGSIDPLFDKQIIEEELRLKDLDTLSKRITKISKKAATGDKEARHALALLKRLHTHLSQGSDARTLALSTQEKDMVYTWQLLTQKPIVYIANIDEDTLAQGDSRHLQALQQATAKENAPLIPLCINLEAQLIQLPPEEQTDFRKAYHMPEQGLATLIQTAYQYLGLITYFTAGPQEVRAWTIKKGTTAPEAAGLIHSDIQRGFIKAEVIPYSDFITYKSELACKQAGKQRVEGKSYVVQDGDILHFKFNV